MTNYNRDKIDKMLQPLMTMMQEEFPNNCKLIIEPHFARIIYEHDEMIFSSDEMKKPFGETFAGEGIKDFIQTMADVVEVVRCKDCKHQDDCARQIVHTTRDYVLEQNISTYNNVDFCSYGERKEE